MEFRPDDFEAKWQERWAKEEVFKAVEDKSKPKYYVLDMFPYPSGAGLHVGHPLGYIASDIVSRFKRLKGYSVLHPMGYDSFGLPAEQYAIQTGQHPLKTTKENILRYRKQLDAIGFSFDWSREVRTSSPEYFKWTQFIFLKLFHSWYNLDLAQAQSIQDLEKHFEINGSSGIAAASSFESHFTASDWKGYSDFKREEILQQFRLAYRSETFVNWCPALGTVLANDEVKEGFSERGGHPVERKKMQQWSLRITAYADRLLSGLQTIDWSDSLKESQKNWIGKSEGAKLFFDIQNSKKKIEVFSTRPDTIYGASFIVLAPEHEWVDELTTSSQFSLIQSYKKASSQRSERERMADVKEVSGAFTGSFAVHPFTGDLLPIWIADYVLAGYGTGAVMAVPAHDSRDWAFAKHFELPIIEVVSGGDILKEAYEAKEGSIINSPLINGLEVLEAKKRMIELVEQRNIGSRKIQYRIRDAAFGRQRYWGEPIPVYYEDGIAKTVREEHLPLNLPEVDQFLPTEDGDPPLGRADKWSYHPEKGLVANGEGYPLELTTMPGWAGSSWYWLRYMDPQNVEEFVGQEQQAYWKEVDLYLGGAEHATGHLLYARFWQKFLKDIGLAVSEEPFKKMINQGMIQGTSSLIYRIEGRDAYVSHGLKDSYTTTAIHIDVNLVENSVVNIEALKKWRTDFADSEFILENGELRAGEEVEKMSKRWHNVVNPDDVVARYGADALRMYEMFLGPLEQHKPWNTNGLSGVSSFLRKLWRLYEGDLSNEDANEKERKSLHKTIKKVSEDIDNFSFNTSVSAFMICVNELQEQKCNKREILEPLLIILSPYAPHIAEELWSKLGNAFSVSLQEWPEYNPKFLEESNVLYPVSFNGKVRYKLEVPADTTPKRVEELALNHELFEKYAEGKAVKKIIVVPKRIVNIVQ